MRTRKDRKPRSRQAPVRKFQGADVVRGRGLSEGALRRLTNHASRAFDGTRDMWIVVEDRALEEGRLVEVMGFPDREAAVRYARAWSHGNVDHRVLHVTAQVLVIGTENELPEEST